MLLFFSFFLCGVVCVCVWGGWGGCGGGLWVRGSNLGSGIPGAMAVMHVPPD